MFAPFIGGFIIMSGLSWRWTQYVPGILASAAAVLNLLFVQETHAPTILVGKASRIRQQTKNWAIHAKQEEMEVNIVQMIERNLFRPIHMLIVEPIVLLIR
jgi:DHA1 family multidrug resistance protein-like MFS transporter